VQVAEVLGGDACALTVRKERCKMPFKILIVDDEPDQIRALARCLEQEGYEVAIVEDEAEALYYLDVWKPDLIVLDIGFGYEERKGLDILKAIRRKDKTIPVIMLTGLDDDRLDPLSYDLDADQFVSKPPSAKAFLARVGRCLRRDKPELEVFDDYMEIDRGSRTVKTKVDGEWQRVPLQPKEFDVLEKLVSNACRVITRGVLYDTFFSDVKDPANSLNTCISKLRDQLEPDPHDPQYILTKRGVGYKFKDYR
jgi:two-component system response regulator VicR